jgi:hypothetical protein
MIHQRQGRLECLPTVVGMLCGVSKDEIIATTLKAIGLESFKTWERALMMLAGGPQSMVDFLTVTVLKSVPWIGFFDLDRAYRERRNIDKEIDPLYMLRHRGVITARHKHGGGHIVAFENNMIFDPEALHPVPFFAWMALYQDSGFHCEHWVEEPQFKFIGDKDEIS